MLEQHQYARRWIWVVELKPILKAGVPVEVCPSSTYLRPRDQREEACLLCRHQKQSPGILKPDVTAPGLNILAAWNTPVDTQTKAPFNIISGTSMATPHVSGIAALIKSLHPDWTPAAIRSAIITSSDNLDREGNIIKDEMHNDTTFYISGAGHVNPVNATEPGLIYDITIDDYIS